MSFPLGLIAIQVEANIVAIEVQKKCFFLTWSLHVLLFLRFGATKTHLNCMHENIVAIEEETQFVSAAGSMRPISALNFAKSFLPLQYWKA